MPITASCDALAETAAEILAPAFPDADRGHLPALVDEILQDRADRMLNVR